MHAALLLMAVGPHLAPGQPYDPQHPTVWYYNSHNVPMPWPSNSYFSLTLNSRPVGPAATAYTSPRVMTAWAAPAVGPAPASLVVHLPAGARLTIDGDPTRSTAATRWFITPPLEPGKVFHYDLKTTVERDGQHLTRARRVAVRAGQQTEVTITVPGPEGGGE